MKSFYIALLSLFLFSCGNDDESEIKDYREINDKEIQNYLENNDLDAQQTNSGLYYIIDEEGTGKQPSSKSKVTVAYKGYFLNGNIFDQSNASGVTFSLEKVIPGWTEGITLFKEGGSGKLLIPSHLAYGPKNRNGIPGGSVLIFDIKLLNVVD